MTLTLADLQCASEEQKRSWLQMARYAPKEKASVVDVFCGDCTVEYKREMEADKRCSRSTDRKRSSTSSGSR